MLVLIISRQISGHLGDLYGMFTMNKYSAPATDELAGLSDEAFVHHSYVRALHRPCNLNEARRALGTLAAGGSRCSLLSEIGSVAPHGRQLPSSQMERSLAKLLKLEGSDFVRRAYIFVLKREADPQGMAIYQNAMDAGISKQEILLSLLQSVEAMKLISTISIADAFSALTGRPVNEPFPLSVSHILNLQKIHNDLFLEAAYRAILGRAADSIGLIHYTKQLVLGRSKWHVIGDLVFSSEARLRPRTFGASVLIRILRHL